jgi:arylsulfatase A-like enzyme
VKHDRDWYDGSIRGMDAEIARLLERLRSLGLADRTLVVFTGDHGEEFLEHGRMFHGQSTYGELANVPLLFWGPGIVAKGPAVDVTVQSIDIMPTLLEISRLPAPEGMQGRSLVPLLAGPAGEARGGPGRSAIVEKAATKGDVGGAPPPRDTESFAVVSAGWKLVHNVKRPAGSPEHELYDHARDPLNLHDVAKDNPEIVQRLAKELDAWHGMANAVRLKADAAAAETLSQEELERLRALGYVQ